MVGDHLTIAMEVQDVGHLCILHVEPAGYGDIAAHGNDVVGGIIRRIGVPLPWIEDEPDHLGLVECGVVVLTSHLNPPAGVSRR